MISFKILNGQSNAKEAKKAFLIKKMIRLMQWEMLQKLECTFLFELRVHIAQRVTTMRINNSKIAPSEVLTGLGSHLSPEISA